MDFNYENALEYELKYWTPSRIAATLPLDGVSPVFSLPTAPHFQPTMNFQKPKQVQPLREIAERVQPKKSGPVRIKKQSSHAQQRTPHTEVPVEQLETMPYKSIGKICIRQDDDSKPGVHVTAFYIGPPTQAAKETETVNAETEKVETAKSKEEPAEAVTAKAETVKAEIAKLEIAKEEPAEAETVKAEPAELEAETAKAETAKVETAKEEPAEPETAEAETAEEETAEAETVKAEPAELEAETAKAETAKVETAKEEPAEPETAEAETAEAETAEAETVKAEPAELEAETAKEELETARHRLLTVAHTFDNSRFKKAARLLFITSSNEIYIIDLIKKPYKCHPSYATSKELDIKNDLCVLRVHPYGKKSESGGKCSINELTPLKLMVKDSHHRLTEFRVIGYPMPSHHFHGKMTEFRGKYSNVDFKESTIEIDNYSSHGMSGGPWIIEGCNGNYVHGIQSCNSLRENEASNATSPLFCKQLLDPLHLEYDRV